MAVPNNLIPGLLPSEAEFIATSSVEIGIVPLMKIDKVRLLSGVYGPLRPPTQARLPLWLALNLKKRKRCSIICPEWLQVENLQKLHREETMNEAFAPVPLHYVAISKVLLQSATDDIPQSDEVRALLKSLREARQSKILAGLSAVNSEHLHMTNISLGEITELRDFLTTANNHLRAIERAAEPEENKTGQEDSRELPYAIGDANVGDNIVTAVEHRQIGAVPAIDESGEASLNSTNMDLF